MMEFSGRERQLTWEQRGHILTNTGGWSPDGEWIVYDTRSDAAGERFDGRTIEIVHVRTGEVRTIYESRHGAHCGAATFHPLEFKVAFILGPENPSEEWKYGPARRQGVIVDLKSPGAAINLDARDLTPPFTPGALRGGSHVHVWDAAGEWVSFTYEDHVLSQRAPTPDGDVNLRNVGVSVPTRAVRVKGDHPRNHNGTYFSVVVTRTTADPTPGTDEIKKACEEGWIGTQGYTRRDGRHVLHALAFQGNVVSTRGNTLSEVFVVDLPDDVTVPDLIPLEGTESRMPAPPKGTLQRRLTFTEDRRFPGIQGARHWMRSSPDGSRIAFLMKDDAGIAQLWTVSPNGGTPEQMTHSDHPVCSAFTWSPDGSEIACVIENSVVIVERESGTCRRLTARSNDELAPRPEACLFSPDGRKVAFVRRVGGGNQVFVADW